MTLEPRASPPPRTLAGQTALATGASGGIGREICVALADGGAAVWATDLDPDPLRALVDEITNRGGQATAIPGDLTVDGGPASLVSTASAGTSGRLDILINCAALLTSSRFLDVEDSEWDRSLSVNLSSAFRCMQASAKVMIPHGYGRIVNITSVAGHTPGFRRATYGASKAALTQVTKSAALELAASGVTANMVAPGPTRTPLLAAAVENGTGGVAAIIRGRSDEYRLGMPIQRLIEPREIVRAVRFLVSTEASGITGQTIHVNGGQYMA